MGCQSSRSMDSIRTPVTTIESTTGAGVLRSSRQAGSIRSVRSGHGGSPFSLGVQGDSRPERPGPGRMFHTDLSTRTMEHVHKIPTNARYWRKAAVREGESS